MAPIYVKGGIWSNVEDEILKLSISKYGLNQWARVSSLLAKKTAKQCKARWNEWLNPNIRKIEWSREEDEKLLRLVKLLPTQWRSIATMVGRTATQCIDRYQLLLDEANGEVVNDSNKDLGLQGPGIESMAGVGRKLQVGDLHLDPESKPARPDAPEMDDEEKEMLSEARARLANTQGKKAKRKLRERMLDESRRIAMLQKRRELKNAGINIKLKKKRKDDDKHFDYNSEIPVYQAPPPGFYDVSKEEEQNNKEQRQFESSVRKHGTKNVEYEKQLQKEKRKKGNQVTVESEAKLTVPEVGDFKRRKLELPEPLTVTGDKDIEMTTLDEDVASLYLEKGLTSNIAPKEQNNVSKQDQLFKEVRALHQRSEIRSSLYGDNIVSETTAASEDDEFDNYVDEFGLEPAIDLKSQFASLPAPKDDYKDVIDNMSDDEVVEQPKSVPVEPKVEIDQGEILKQKAIEDEKLRQLALLRRSQVLQRVLPIPHIDNQIKSSDDYVQRLIDDEMVSLITSDYHKRENDLANPLVIEDLDEEAFQSIQKQLQLEISKEKIPEKDYTSIVLSEIQALSSGLPGLDSTNATNEQIQLLINELKTTAANSSKLEKKLLLLNGGYSKRHESLMLNLYQLESDLLDANLQLKTYLEIESLESVAIDTVTRSLQERVDVLVQAEGVGQRRYDELVRR